MHNKKPFISIITIVFNGEKYLEKTIKSIIDQTYGHIEYIIIDGGSTDKTLDIIQKYEDKINFWSSKKDNGIFDAMNKGINQVNGTWINFMNAGDTFVDHNVLKKVSNELSGDIDVLYGDVIVQYDKKSAKHVKPNDLTSFYKGMPFCHQSCFISSKLMKEKKYNLNYKVCADFDFFYTAYLNGVKFGYINQTIALYDYNGISTHSDKAFKEQRDIVLSNDKTYRLYYSYIYYRNRFKKYIKSILPLRLIRKIQMIKNGKRVMQK